MTLLSRHLVHPSCEPLTQWPTGKLSNGNLAKVRSLPPMIPVPDALDGVASSRVTATGTGGHQVDLLLLEPTAKSDRLRPLVLFAHGGGMIMGSADQATFELPQYIKQLDFVLASVEYRLAPEAQFPAQQDDLTAAYEWLLANAERLAIDTDNIVVMGVSAGGGLAASFTQMLRDKNLPQVAAQILIFPMLDARTGSPDAPHNNPYTGEFVWTREHNQFGWHSLRGQYQADDARKGWFSAALADHLADLPPAFVISGALDLFTDEILDYSRRLLENGVPTELHLYPGAVHGFNMMMGSPLAQQYRDDLERFLTRQFA